MFSKKKLKVSPEEAYKVSVKKMCFSAEGDGFINLANKEFSFNYESFINEQEESWGLGISIPLHGEEVIKAFYKEALNGKVIIEGNIYRRLVIKAADRSNNRDAKRQLKLTKAYVKSLAKFLKFLSIKNSEMRCTLLKHDETFAKGRCLVKEDENFDWLLEEDEFLVKYPLGPTSNSFLQLRFTKDSGLIFRRINSALIKRDEDGAESHLVSLNLSLKNCFSEQQ